MDKEIPEHLKKWNWGAFFLNWIWGVGNNTYSAFKIFIPVYGFYYIFKLGAHGSEYAWKNGTWRDEDHFVKVQRNWSRASFAYIGLCFLLALPLFFMVGHLFRNSEPYIMSMALLEGSPKFKEEIGVPYDAGFITGNLSTSGHQGSANMSFGVDGARGEAKIYIKAEKDMDIWKLLCVKTEYINSSTVELLGECANGS
ncbi:cytochrome c oxidase assembly factor Coa1 family protein [Teredinibacter purpureus]|uniref:cytochrome c oxidase assembly factor Coa1 family protein n=1 Tax=Teredinibacter purpureus TaxID=2731756 RepID=UPI0005F82CEC|nr:cytochrome c oxidase assembly factor Coa1 family protein [Teredinibacter purpureus]